MSRARSRYDAICMPLGASALGGAERSLLDVAGGFAARGASVLVLGEEPLRGTAFTEMAKARNIRLEWVAWRPERSRIRNAISAWRIFRRFHAPFLYFNVGWRRGMWVIPLVARLAMRTCMVGSMRAMPDPHWLVKRRRYLGIIPGLRLWHIPEVVVGWLWGRLLDVTVCVNAGDYPSRLVAHYGYPRSRIRVILNGIVPREGPLTPDRRREMRARLGWTDEHVVVGFVGRLSPEKGCLSLLEALRGLPESIHVMVLGDGPQRPELERSAAELALQHRVAFLGFIDQPGDLIACCDIVAVPSTVQEAFGRSTIESLNEGVPVIASSVGGMAELFTDGVEGRYITAGDGRMLAEAIGKLAVDPGLRRAMGQAGRQLVRDKYALARTVEEYCHVYDECVKPPHPGASGRGRNASRIPPDRLSSGRTRAEGGGFEREWRRRFESFARGATAPHQVSGWSEPGLRRRVAAFRSLLASQGWGPGRRALDLGSGAGTYVRLLAEDGYRVIGVDYSTESLRASLAADPARMGQYVGAEAYSLPFPAETFDLVIVIGVFQALSEPERALREVHRILRPGGYLVLEILNADEVFLRVRKALDRLQHRSSPVRSYRRKQIGRWLRSSGFHPVSATPIFLPPRSRPAFEQVLEHPVPRALLHNVPGLSLLGAAAFLILAHKEPATNEPATPKS